MATGLSGKVAIVTGVAASNGIGYATAHRLALEGVHLLITDIKGQNVAQRAREIGLLGGEVEAMRHDVTSGDDWFSVCDQAVARWGGVDFLVNNAGILRMANVAAIPAGEWEMMLSVNLSSGYLGIHHVAPIMQARGGGAIVNMCSVSGILGTPHCGAYSAAKGGLRAYTKCAAIDLAPVGIRVNSVHPGFVATDMQSNASEGLGEDAYEAALQSVPARRFGTPKDIAGAVAFLLSDDASYITGTELIIDGGLTCSV